jgi:hypothetical protein
MNDWNIQSRAHACEACGHPFADKQTYYTRLFDEPPLLRRSDICEPCAKKAKDQRGQTGYISHWQGVYEAPPAQAADPIQKDTAETLLRKLVEQNDPRYAPAAYILAVMLERKRLLKVKEQFTRGGQRVFIYEHPKSGDIFTIADPDLHLDQLQEVQQDVARLLEHGLNQTAADSPPIPAPEKLPEPPTQTLADSDDQNHSPDSASATPEPLVETPATAPVETPVTTA